MSEPTVRSHSPWGPIQSATVLAPGIVSVSTAGHGGIWLSPEREAQIPENVRAIARQYAPSPWYEEDCDSAIVALWFADEMMALNEGAFVSYSWEYANADPRMRPLVLAVVAKPKQAALNAIVAANHARQYPQGCPLTCEACTKRLQWHLGGPNYDHVSTPDGV